MLPLRRFRGIKNPQIRPELDRTIHFHGDMTMKKKLIINKETLAQLSRTDNARVIAGIGSCMFASCQGTPSDADNPCSDNLRCIFTFEQ
jgi:hypothetical protein